MSKPDLTVSFCGIELDNPLIVASSPLTVTLERIRKAEKYGAGAVITKMAVIKSPYKAIDRFYVASHGTTGDLFYTYGGRRLELKEAQKLIQDAKRTVKIPVIANFTGENLEVWAKMARSLEEAGADMLELNISSLI